MSTDGVFKTFCNRFTWVGYLVCLVTGAVLLVLAFERVNFDQYAVLYDRQKGTVEFGPDGQSYEAGVYFVGIERDFLRFPRTWATVDYGTRWGCNQGAGNSTQITTNTCHQEGAIPARVRDGLEITLRLSIQFSVNPLELRKVYLLYGDDVYGFFSRSVRSRVRDVAARYYTDDYFAARTKIEEDMYNVINEEIDERGLILQGFQIDQIDIFFEYDAWLEDIELRRYGAVVEAERAELNLEYAAGNASVQLANAEYSYIEKEYELETMRQLFVYEAELNEINLNTSNDVALVAQNASRDIQVEQLASDNTVLEFQLNQTLEQAETDKAIANVTATYDLLVLEEERNTETERLQILLNETRERQETLVQLAQLNISANRDLAEYEAGTDLLRAETSRNATIFAEETLTLVYEVEDVTRTRLAELDADIEAIRAAAAEHEHRIVGQARADYAFKVLNASQSLLSGAFTRAEFSFSKEHVLLLAWLEAYSQVQHQVAFADVEIPDELQAHLNLDTAR